ncbi:hypothetical protein TREVI0001_1063 [Treponema vincentii ATCC 35580]|uniref:Uncharacterized protein n=1 Tax=Treponema vincentii ATCC 35580 TaxID=596324 RepID=C8PM30_9SPIR|nr:hypothetical protein TREVI0001_1063 [Treponema vincentii ATCC 35580]
MFSHSYCLVYEKVIKTASAGILCTVYGTRKWPAKKFPSSNRKL